MSTPLTRQAIMMVPMRESTVARLLALREAPDEALDHIAERLAAGSSLLNAGPTAVEPQGIASAASGHPKYCAIVLGTPVTASTLGELFAGVVDLIHDLDASVIERLAHRSARTRRFVAADSAGVHGAGRDRLPVLQTRTGWWVSANVGQEDVRRCLKALCSAARLSYGSDIVFPVGR